MRDENDIYLSIVIPAYNEEKRIGRTLENIVGYLKTKDYECEIIVVDDGSTDSTREMIRRFEGLDSRLRVIENKIGKGKGYSVRRGMLETRGKFALFSDADLSTPIEEIEKLIYWLEKDYDIAIGSRDLPDSQVEIHQSFLREGMGKIFNKIMNLMVFTGFKDTQCGFKCFKRYVVNEVFGKQRINGFAFDVENILIAMQHGFRIKEVPVRWLNSPYSKVSVVRDPALMLYDLFRIKFNNFAKKYNQ
jgi:dolichyl-phosphate beta-glucosyltransferase